MSAACVAMALVCLVFHSDASAFLRADAPRDEVVNVNDVDASFAMELVHTLGHAAGEGRILRIEAVLGPMYSALPTNELGNLGHATVRYALNRFFSQEFGWSVKGLQSSGESWNATSPSTVLKGSVPSYLQAKLEQRLAGRGVNLRELAVLVATIEDLVHNEAVARLKAAYEIHQLSPTGLVDEQEADSVIDTYMVSLILGLNLTSTSRSEIMDEKNTMIENYPEWYETKEWTRDMRMNVAHAKRHSRNPFVIDGLNFAATAHIVEEIGEGYGRFQETECRKLKHRLLEYEDAGTGRVRLSEFYKAALDGEWAFSETVDYLRSQGVLDESDPRRPSVVVPNYISSRGNCLTTSSFYSVCCQDECQSLLGHLEKELGSATAEPSQITRLVQSLASDTVDAPRVLSEAMTRRLSELAVSHGGRVPLHGRLFAQWLHHAYPRECPYPHESGSTTPMSPEEWMERTGGDVGASEEEMFAHSNSTNQGVNKPKELPWTDSEELLFGRMPAKSGQSMWTGMCNLIFCLVPLGLLLGSVVSFKPASNKKLSAAVVSCDKSAKYLV